jgi:hypothetical protein
LAALEENIFRIVLRRELTSRQYEVVLAAQNLNKFIRRIPKYVLKSSSKN